jgi:molybdate transport system regulatory protein
MNNCFVSPLVLSVKGGSGGGGAQVTPLGAEVLACYRALEKKAQAALRKEIGSCQRFLREKSLITESPSADKEEN